jgi:diguanylate cyclase (GGDEF)-like protein
MSASNSETPASTAAPGTASLIDALNQSEQVHEKVEQAATELSAVNAVLKDRVDSTPPLKVERALRKSERVEAKVQEAAEQLAIVNDALGREIDERQRLEDQLAASAIALTTSQADATSSRDEALHDAVTGLPNLTLFNDRLRSAIAQSERHAWRLAVMFIDLNGFKAVNDSHGHAAGDRVLQLVSERLLTIVRKGDTLSRRSGDEFLFLILEAKDDAIVRTLAERIGAKIAEPCEIDGAQITVGASIGVAIYPQDGALPNELLESADSAMYAAKQQRTLVTFFAELAAT